ncbi:MAG: peptidylprolyl isomerase [Myxococcota bacterium]
MPSLPNRLLREPLFHFLLLGAALFVLYDVVLGERDEPDRIVVDATRVEQLALGFTRVWQRPPSEAELAGLVEDFVREEVYYREALAMGLDRDDTIVRRRMRQKLEFLSEDLVALAEPGEAELEAWLAEQADDYRVEPRAALRQVYVSRERHGEAAEATAEELLARLEAGEEDPAGLGDASLLPAALPLSSQREIAKHFGDEFATAVLTLEPGVWSGPVESTFGLHLVLLEAREPGRTPSLDEVRQVVERDWAAARREEANEAFYQALRERYEVTIEPPGPPRGEP